MNGKGFDGKSFRHSWVCVQQSAALLRCVRILWCPHSRLTKCLTADCDIEVKDWRKVTLIDCVKGFSDFAASLLSFCRLLFLFRHRKKKSMPHRVILVGMAFFCLFTTTCQKLDLRRRRPPISSSEESSHTSRYVIAFNRAYITYGHRCGAVEALLQSILPPAFQAHVPLSFNASICSISADISQDCAIHILI